MLKQVPASMVAVSTSSKIRDAAKSLNESCLKSSWSLMIEIVWLGQFVMAISGEAYLTADMDQCAMAIANKKPNFCEGCFFSDSRTNGRQ